MSDWIDGPPPPPQKVSKDYRASNGRVYRILARSPEQADAVVRSIESRVQNNDPNLSQGMAQGVKVTLPTRPPTNFRGQSIGPTDQSFRHNAAVVARNLIDGLVSTAGDATDLMTGQGIAESIANRITGENVPSMTPAAQIHRALDETHFGEAKTTGQDREAAMARGVGGALPFGVGGGLRSLAMTALSGASGGLASQGAKEHGYGPVGQAVAGLIAGLPAGVAAGEAVAGRSAHPEPVGKWVDGPPPEEAPPPPPPGPNVAEFAHNKAIADHATEHNLDPVEVGRLYSHGNDPKLKAAIDRRTDHILSQTNVPEPPAPPARIQPEGLDSRPAPSNDFRPATRTEKDELGYDESHPSVYTNDKTGEAVSFEFHPSLSQAHFSYDDPVGGHSVVGKFDYDTGEFTYRNAADIPEPIRHQAETAAEQAFDYTAQRGSRDRPYPSREERDREASMPPEPEQPSLPLDTQIDPEAEYRAEAGGGGQEPPREPPSGGGEGGGDEPPSDGGDEMFGPDSDPNHPVNKLIAAIKRAKQARTETDKLHSEELSRRVATGAAVGKDTSGTAGFASEKAQLAGKMPTAEFEGIGSELSQSDIEGLFDHVKNHPTFNFFESINARQGLAKLLGAAEGVPTKSELKLLSQVFPHDVLSDLMKGKGGLGEKIANVLNVPRALMASFDLSAPGRQGIFLIGSKAYWTSFLDMFKAFGSDRAWKAINDSITARPNYQTMKKYGLALTNTGKTLSEREEAFMSNLAEKIPVAGRIVRASDRAYSGYLNKLRADTVDKILNDAKNAGVNLKPKELRDIMGFVNNATGRGSLGRLNQAAPLLSAGFFSPRLIASRLALLNPIYYTRLSPVARKAALKALLSFSGIALTVLSLAKAGGAEVEADPRSSDFGKIKIGNTRYDMLGGFQQYIRTGAQLITGQVKDGQREYQDSGRGVRL
jgi:hypothetical protein